MKSVENAPGIYQGRKGSQFLFSATKSEALGYQVLKGCVSRGYISRRSHTSGDECPGMRGVLETLKQAESCSANGCELISQKRSALHACTPLFSSLAASSRVGQGQEGEEDHRLDVYLVTTGRAAYSIEVSLEYLSPI